MLDNCGQEWTKVTHEKETLQVSGRAREYSVRLASGNGLSNAATADGRQSPA